MLETSKETCALAINALCLSLGADRVAVLAVSPDSRHTVVASRPTNSGTIVAPALVDVVARTRRTLQRATEDESAIAIAPIFADADGVILGVLFVGRDRPGAFEPAEILVIEALALQILPAEVTETPRLRRDTIADAFGLNDPTSVVWGETEVEDLEGAETADDDVLLAFGEAMLLPAFSVDGVQDLFGQAVENMLAMARSHVAAVLLVDGVDFVPVAIGATPHAPNVAADELISRTVVEQVMWTGEPVLTIDARGGDLGMSAQSIHKLEITMVMCVPVVVDSEMVGALYTATFSLGTNFDQETADKLLAVAQALAPALAALGPAPG